MKQEIVYINVHDIIPNRFQARIKIDDNKLNELANSIKKYGIIYPLILRKLDDKYEVIAGERRYKAALMVGLQTVPSIVMELTDKESAELALIENVQREDLNSIEEAKSYDYLIKNENQSKEQISQSISKNIATIDSKLRYLELTDKVKDALLNNLISEGHAKVLLKLNDKNKQDMMLDKIINERLNVKDASIEVKNINESNQKQLLENDVINLKDLNQPDLALERNNINNALNEINLDNENNKGEYNMNEFNNMMNNDMNMNNINNGGLNQINEQPQQNRFFTSLEDQQVNLNNQQVTPPSDELVIPSFNPSQLNVENINSGPSFNMPENNMNITAQPEMNNQNTFMATPMSEQTMNIPTQEPIQQVNDDIGNVQNNNQMPMNDFNNIPQMEPQTNPFMTPEMNNPFASHTEQQNPFMVSGINQNPFEQPMNNNPFDMNQTQNMEMAQQPMNNIPEINSMNNPFQMETPQMPVDNNYGANFAPKVNQPNPAIDKIKMLVDELRNSGFNIELSEADLMDSFQLTINIKK